MTSSYVFNIWARYTVAEWWMGDQGVLVVDGMQAFQLSFDSLLLWVWFGNTV